MRHIKLTDGNLDFHSRVIYTAQNLDDTADGWGVPRWRVNNLNRHHLPRVCPHGVGGRDNHIVFDPLVFRHHQQDAPFID